VKKRTETEIKNNKTHEQEHQHQNRNMDVLLFEYSNTNKSNISAPFLYLIFGKRIFFLVIEKTITLVDSCVSGQLSPNTLNNFLHGNSLVLQSRSIQYQDSKVTKCPYIIFKIFHRILNENKLGLILRNGNIGADFFTNIPELNVPHCSSMRADLQTS
jgi:hypothetical protein